MRREIKIVGLVVLGLASSTAALAQRSSGNGAAVGKGGFLLNVIAFEQCPAGDFLDSNRHMIAVQADYSGAGTDKSSKTNKIFLKAGDFSVTDGNGCDNDGARFYLPVEGNCSNCGDPLDEPIFTAYEVYARVVGKPGASVEVTTCLEYVTDTDELESLCSVGAGNVYVGLRETGGGKLQNRWDNVSTELLTLCLDTDGDGNCDQRVGLFDEFGEDYWWNWDTSGRPHVQLVFVPVS